MSNVVGSFTALAGSVAEEAREHSTGLLFTANCALWFLAGYLTSALF